MTPFYESEHRLRHKSGRWIWNLALGKVIERDSNGIPLRMIGVNYDITDRKETEEASKASRAGFTSIVEMSSDGILVLDEEGRVLYANPAAIRLLGRSKEDVGKIWFGGLPLPREVGEIRVVREDGSVGLGEMRLETTDWDGKGAHLANLRDGVTITSPMSNPPTSGRPAKKDRIPCPAPLTEDGTTCAIPPAGTTIHRAIATTHTLTMNLLPQSKTKRNDTIISINCGINPAFGQEEDRIISLGLAGQELEDCRSVSTTKAYGCASGGGSPMSSLQQVQTD